MCHKLSEAIQSVWETSLISIILSHPSLVSLLKGYMIVALSLLHKSLPNNLLKRSHKAEPQRQGHSYSSVMFSASCFSIPWLLKARGICILHPLEFRIQSQCKTPEVMVPNHRLLPVSAAQMTTTNIRVECSSASGWRAQLSSGSSKDTDEEDGRGNCNPARPSSGWNPVPLAVQWRLLLFRAGGQNEGWHLQLRGHSFVLLLVVSSLPAMALNELKNLLVESMWTSRFFHHVLQCPLIQPKHLYTYN